MKNKGNSSIFIILILVIILAVIIKFAISSDNSTNSGYTGSNVASSTDSDTVEVDEDTTDLDLADIESKEYTDFDAKVNLTSLELTGTGVTIQNNTITISKEGTYYFTGKLSDGNIIVNAEKSKVILVFENAEITSTKTAVINVTKAKSVTINLVNGSTNVFTDSSNYTEFTDEDEPNGTIFSKSDLYITGSGILKVNANYNNAIKSKDAIGISKATIQITSVDDGIRADKIVVNSGNIKITSEGDSIHSNGSFIINDGKIEISSGDDAIHADNNILINNGTINITKSYEGIEANYIKINTGKISVIASDDGINVSGGNSMGMMGEGTSGTVADNARQLIINGGTIYVKAQGDGLDANGSIVINGGDVTVVGTTNNGNGALDYDKIFNMNGGNLIVYGATGMWQNPSTSSKQYTICFGVSGSTGDKIVLKDSSGNEITNFTTENSYGAITISNSELKKGETYTLYINGTEKSSQELTSIVTSNLTTGGMQGGMQGRGMGR